MLTLTKYGNHYNKNVMYFVGKSSDEKPVGKFNNIVISNGSEFFELDTKVWFTYDEESSIWVRTNQ